ncbi:MAG TPA: hypothetical protein DIC56_05700 [Rhizobium sp.]|nr:hypothetical protein [Rhizobium sp.]
MRRFILTTAVILAGGPAMASSIEVVGSVPVSNSPSIVVMSCGDCPIEAKKEKPSYIVPTLGPVEQKAEIIELDGEKKLFRTEAWMGGSPVVFVSKADGWATDGTMVTASAASATPGLSDGIDLEATTAAVVTNAGVAPASAAMSSDAGASGKTLDLSGFELRLN